MSDALPPDQLADSGGQLLQASIPLHDAALAFTVPDEHGRLPIVVVPVRVSRVDNRLLFLALVIGGAGVLTGSTRWAWLLPLALVAALVLVVLAVYRSFIVRIPEGSNGLLAQGGRYWRTLGAGTHYVLPHVAVTHLVTRREIPYDVPLVEATTRDNVRAMVDTLLTFSIAEPFRFVYNISAGDFERVLHAASQDALRTLVRGKTPQQVLDLQRDDTAVLLQAISRDVEAYGVVLQRVVVTFAQLPEDHMRTQELRQLAILQRAEETERHNLALQRQADAAELTAQQVAADAASEALRLQQLEERILRNPAAAQYDLERTRLDVARALAGNNRALLNVGSTADLAPALQLEPASALARIAADGLVRDDAPI